MIIDNFGYDYFDNSKVSGYQGYTRGRNGVFSWDDLDEIVLFCKSTNLSTVFDIGCAKGYLVRALFQAGFEVVGYDISEYALLFAMDLPCYPHDIRESLPKQADIVFCLNVLMYIEPTHLETSLHNVANSASKLLLFSSYYAGVDQFIPRPIPQIMETKEWWKMKIVSNGFHLLRSEKFFDVYERN